MGIKERAEPVAISDGYRHEHFVFGIHTRIIAKVDRAL